jgi:hypothetical protein
MQKHDLHFDGPGRYLIVIKEKVSQDIFEMFHIKVFISLEKYTRISV